MLACAIGFLLQIVAPGFADLLVFYPPVVLLRPWSILTYMFVHGSPMHIIFNMIALYFFGPRVEERIGSRRFTILYFLSGFTGALLSLIFAPMSPIIGASAGVFGVMMAFAYYWPEVQILVWGIIPVPARMMVILTTLLAFWSGFGGVRDNIAHFAHLGGYAGAYLYLRWLDRARSSFRRKATAAPPEASKRIEGWQSIDLARVHEVNREQLNRILDKIHAQGLASLTPDERIFLSNFVPPDDRALPTQ